MSRTWQLQEAKNRLSEVVDEAVAHGPQVITRSGKRTAVILSYEEYRRLDVQKANLTEFFRTSPLASEDLDLSRDSSPVRAEPEL
jgi:prevent-host-death family protein